eukprot:TRINITY_DN60892_c0_g1_i1.p1 TRINITY_DN60892_c0_g1~~TRINITY_DN60892_c0_g1_i1.p1  ORF type:complete len:876 (-),score=160.33 TRINITY_DN60892_c0_g1_i1:68-2632(-)
MRWRHIDRPSKDAAPEISPCEATLEGYTTHEVPAAADAPLQRRGRWSQSGPAPTRQQPIRASDLPASNLNVGPAFRVESSSSKLCFGPGSSPAVDFLAPESSGDEGSNSTDEESSDDEGESMMAPGREGREGRKMYFRTLDDSIKEQGLHDASLGTHAAAAELASLSSLGIGSSSRARLEISRRVEADIPSVASSAPHVAVAVTCANDSAAKQRNLRRARQRAKARGEEAAEAAPGGCVMLIREDCRLHDNPALHAAAEEHPWVLPLYVHDDEDPSPWPVRGAGLWWRHESLTTFDKALQGLGSRIIYRKGRLVEQVMDILLSTGATALHFNLQLEPWHHERDLELEAIATESLGVQVRTFTAMVMKFEPWEERKPPARKGEVRRRHWEPLPAVHKNLPPPPGGWPWSEPLAALGYGRTAGRKIPPGFRQFNEKRQAMHDAGIAEDPKENDWAYEMRRFWPMGEAAAMKRLEEWLKDAAWGCYFPPGLHPRDEVGGRFRADKAWTAMLSPYLRFGDLSPRYVNKRVCQVLSYELRQLFLKRVVWRDKAYAQLYRCPDSHSVSIRPQYEHETWSGTRLQLRRWQRGETGFPLVDAAMRQLWKVGWMCNHLRHVTAQFLIEHLDLNWKDGFAWYDYTLVDTDVAINAMMWQMGGHSGIGSWNFVMHPVFAGKKVDPDGTYVRRWLPELRHLPTEYIHCPWEAPAGTRISANVLVNGVYWQRVIEDLVAARLVHQKHVIAVRKLFPQFVKEDGNEVVRLSNGQTLHLDVRDDIRENDEENITLVMTADDPRSVLRRNLGNTKGVHNGLIYEAAKRFESLYDAFDAAQPRRQRPSRSKDRAAERANRLARQAPRAFKV